MPITEISSFIIYLDTLLMEMANGSGLNLVAGVLNKKARKCRTIGLVYLPCFTNCYGCYYDFCESHSFRPESSTLRE